MNINNKQNNQNKYTINNYENENDDDAFNDLDTSWIQEFDKIENEYKNYYCEPLEFINLNCIYLNKENEITYIHEEKVIFKTSGYLSREEVLGLIKRRSFFHNVKHSLLSILVFNINIEPENLKTFLRMDKNKNRNNQIGSPFLKSIKNIDSITFDKSISLFHDINNLFFIFYEKEQIHNPHTVTKRITINPNSFSKATTNKHTKTKRKLYKDNMI